MDRGLKNFEYYSQYMIPEEGEYFKSQLDAMGLLGWELVNIVEEDKGVYKKHLAIFKREVMDNKPKKELLLEEDGSTQ